jgi:hypothetical protein
VLDGLARAVAAALQPKVLDLKTSPEKWCAISEHFCQIFNSDNKSQTTAFQCMYTNSLKTLDPGGL